LTHPAGQQVPKLAACRIFPREQASQCLSNLFLTSCDSDPWTPRDDDVLPQRDCECHHFIVCPSFATSVDAKILTHAISCFLSVSCRSYSWFLNHISGQYRINRVSTDRNVKALFVDYTFRACMCQRNPLICISEINSAIAQCDPALWLRSSQSSFWEVQACQMNVSPQIRCSRHTQHTPPFLDGLRIHLQRP